jgi:tetratricopeptide (TPR) repeat protein
MPKSSRSRPAAATSPRTAELLQRGLHLHQSGRAAEAAPLYEQVLALDPKQPAANHLLGVVRLAEGRLDDAIHLISRAVAADGKNAQYLGNLGVAFNAAELHRDALEALRRAVALKPDFAEAHTNMGTALRALGRFAEAAEAHRAAVYLKPEQAGFHFNLGNALEDAGELHDAEASYSEAIRLRPGHVGAMAGRSRVLLSLRRFDDALDQARLAVAEAPDSTDAHMALGYVLQQSGRLSEAAMAFRRILELDPGSGEAYFRLAHQTRHVSRQDGVTEMERTFRDESLPRSGRVWAGFGLGKALADIGEHEESMGAYRAANAMWRQDVAAVTRQEVARLGATARQFAAAAPRAETAGYADYAPIFIVGLPRAGKTTLENIISRHPAAYATGEHTRLAQLVADLGARGRVHASTLQLSEVTDAQWRQLGERYCDYARLLVPAGRRSIDTMPANFEMIGFIRLAMPNARIIHCVRDPLEQCVAIFEKLFGRSGYDYSFDLEQLATYYGAYRRLMSTWHALYPGAILDIDGAELRRDTGSVLRPLLEFCGLDWVPGLGGAAESEPQLGSVAPKIVERRRLAHLDAYRPLLEPLLRRALNEDGLDGSR